MPGDLLTICANVQAELVAAQPYCRCYVGASHMREESSPPRVVFVPKSENLIPGTDGRSGETTSPGAVRVIAVRVVEVEAHVWGAKLDGSGHADASALETDHIDATEQLLVDFLAACHRTTWAYQVRPLRGTWASETGALIKLGALYTASLEWRISVPLVETTGTVRVVTLNQNP